MNEIVKYKNNHFFKIIKLYKIWLMLIMFIIISIVFLCNKIFYRKYYQNSGIVIDKNIISILVVSDDLNKILENETIIINKNEFAYKIVEIKETLNFNNVSYNEILLNVKLPNKMNIINNSFDIKIFLEEETILKYIYNKVKGKK